MITILEKFCTELERGGGALWSYFPNKANKWNIRKQEKTKKNVNFKNSDTLRLRKCKNMF
jgi:hypothetical protein